MTDNTCVKVAVRIRPQLAIDNFEKICTTVVENEPQIFIGKDKAFTFDEVFDISSTQEEIYNCCVKELVQGCFEGYNATVLAYGQTGSGKTYTMGTGFDVMLKPYQRGIVPRAIDHIFQEVENRRTATIENGGFIPDIKIDAQFIELYNEDIIDLLDPVDSNGRKRQIKIHEDNNGVIYCVGLFVPCITTVEEALECLKTGSLSRTTASTQMNLQSSRSHAIFSIHIKQQRVAKLPSCTDSCNSEKHEHNPNLNEFETLTAKFHFVDLAGSERLKRTQATGDRQKEGISINSGLLALGNVISALGDKSRRAIHVPYRDSKLTRLLQDSLGGNSRTLMIACISPSDRDFMETLNTLTYANRAKKIKNKVTVNMDKTSQTISLLREEVENLRLTLLEYKQGKRIIGANGVECVNDMYHENAMLRNENNTLKTRVKALQEAIEHLTARNIDLIADRESNQWGTNGSPDVKEVVKGYIKEIETLRARLLESEELNTYLRSAHTHNNARYSSSPTSTVAITGAYDIRSDSPGSVNELIVEAKDNVRKLKKRKKKLASTIEKEGGENSGTDEDKDIDEKNEDEEGDVIMPEDSSSGSEEQDDYSANLAGLTCEISMKEKLIRQLEMQQRRMVHMQQCYEEKIIQLQTTIQQTEKERDTFNFNKGAEHNEKARRVNEDFERKINNLKKDMQKMEVAKKQHVNMMKNESHFATELAKLRNELSEMKRAKVVLMNKMKDEAKKHKESEYKKLKEITQLKKQQRTKDTRIKALEAEKTVKDSVLKRKQEELVALRKRNKVQTMTRNRAFSVKIAKQKWQTLEKKVSKLVMNKQSISHIEKDMNYYLLEREKLRHCLDNVERKLNRAKLDLKDEEVIQNLEEERSNLMLNLDYAYEQINECQISITQIDNVKDDMDAGNLPDFFKQVSGEEMKYLMEKLLSMCINQSFQVVQQESNVKELEQQLEQVIENNSVQEQLLMHIIHQANENISGLILPKMSDGEEDSGSNGSLYSSIDSHSKVGSEKQATYVIDNPRKKKARELAVTAEDILFSGNHNPVGDSEEASFTLEDYNVLENFPTQVNSAVIKGRQCQNDNYNMSHSPPQYSPNYSHLGSLTRPVTPDSSLLCGELMPFIGTSQSPVGRYLKCTYIADGHKDGVVCIASTNDVLFSGSRDCTVKIWDLNTGKEISQLVGHPNYVSRVRYCEYTRLAFTSSLASIKIWDMRQKSACIQTLRSSGVSQKGSSTFEDRGSKQSIPPGEHQINDIALNHFGTALFSAASGAIRMWDLKMYQSIASLNCGFQSNVSCITVDEDIVDENRVISGLSDHSIKIFEVFEHSHGIHSPKHVLRPPHYDGIQALTAAGGSLFSASTDTCIKQWDLNTMTLRISLPPSSGDWLCAFNLVPSGKLFLTGCRSGYLHLYSADTFQSLEKLRAHTPAINAISSNQTAIFTASDDSTIGIWKLRAAGHEL